MLTYPWPIVCWAHIPTPWGIPTTTLLRGTNNEKYAERDEQGEAHLSRGVRCGPCSPLPTPQGWPAHAPSPPHPPSLSPPSLGRHAAGGCLFVVALSHVVLLSFRTLTPPSRPPSGATQPEPPDEYVCPITNEVMRDPVAAGDGRGYEREAIETWLELGNR